MAAPPDLRWKLADGDPQGALFGDGVTRHQGKGEFRGMEFIHVNAKTIINEVPAASHMPFRYTINAYRGCQHACTFCFARPTHEYLGMNSGDDFDTKIVVKVNAVERLRAEVRRPNWAGEHIAMGTNTDPYQRCEGKYHLTRGIVEVLAEARNPFSILTKSTLILRDLDLLAEAAKHAEVKANFSIGTLDDDVWRMTEPGTPHPRRRVEAIAKLNQAGVRCGVLVAPVLPRLSDAPEQLETVVKACVEAGATSITPILLHLRPGVREQYLGWLQTARPDLVEHYQSLYPKSYAPRRTQLELTTLVRQLVAKHGGRVVEPRQARDVAVVKTARLPEPQQLSLKL
ncbi:MAG: radical SAM protein [Actinomycetota bacterium]|nr:radical SAM protein [Actinomycetota bacterium]